MWFQSEWTPGQQVQAKRRPGLKPESAQPHEVASLLPAEEFFSHVADRQRNPGTEPGRSWFEPPFYYSSGAIDEKVVVKEGMAPLLPELTEGLLPQLQPLPQHDIRPHLWLGQPGVSVTLHYDTNDNTYVQLHGAKRFLLLPPAAARYVYLHPVHHPHNGQARAHFDLLWDNNATGLEREFPAFSQVWGLAQEGLLRGGEILVLPANWLHHVITESPPPNPADLEEEASALSVSVNLWRKCPTSCNFAMGHLKYTDDQTLPLAGRRLRLQAFVSAVVRKLLLRSEGLEERERVDVVYPGPGRRRYPAVLRERAGIGPAWLIEWEDGDTLHTKASPYSIYRRGGVGSEGGVYPAATPERSFAGELMEQRYLGLMDGVDAEGHGGSGLMSGEWAGSEDGMVHPLDPMLEEAYMYSSDADDNIAPGPGRWPGLAAEVRNAVAQFEA